MIAPLARSTRSRWSTVIRAARPFGRARMLMAQRLTFRFRCVCRRCARGRVVAIADRANLADRLARAARSPADGRASWYRRRGVAQLQPEVLPQLRHL